MNGSRFVDSPLFRDQITPFDEDQDPRDYEAEYNAWLGQVKSEAGKRIAAENPVFQDFRLKAQTAIRFLAATGHEFTADDVTKQTGPPPNRYIMGALISAAVTSKQIEATGYTKSTRTSSHGRVLRTYRGVK